MKPYFRRNRSVILVAVLAIFILLTITGYFYPSSRIGDLLHYYNGISSLIIVLLTLMYVITTNRQLIAMQNQLNIMDSSVKLQIQPLPVPSIEDIHLEKIRPYVGPETKFTKIEICSRFHFKIDFRNAGTGAALNMNVFASIGITSKDQKVNEIEIPQIGPRQIHLICESEKQPDSIKKTFMIIDNKFEIFKSLKNDSEVVLKLRIYYKNIFGSGFLEEAQYRLSLEDEQQEDLVKLWDEFVKDGIKALNEDLIRYESLKSKLPKEAKETFDKVKDLMGKRFEKDLRIKYDIDPRSYNVRIVDFETALASEEQNNKNLIKTYRPGTYNMLFREK